MAKPWTTVTIDLAFAKATKSQWVYDIMFNGVPVGTAYLPKILLGAEQPGDQLAADIKRKS